MDLNFRVLAETIPHLVWSARADGFRDYFNARLLAYLGKTLEEMQGWTWQEVLHPDDRQKTVDAWTEAKTKGTEFSIEYRIRRGADGAYRWHEGRATPVRDAAGNILRWFGTCTDIEERKRAEEKLRHSEEKFRSVMELSPDIISIIGQDGTLTYNSPAALSIHGYPLAEMVGKNTFELIHPDDQARCLAFTSALLNNLPSPHSVQYRYRNKDGSYVWMEATASNQLNNPHIGGLVVISRTITERKHAEEALAAAKETAEVASRAKSEFLANMSHEVRTPITGILGMAELLEGTELSACQHGYLKTLLASTENLLTLVNDILDLSKIEAGKVELERKEFSLRDVLSAAVGEQILVANTKGLPIKMFIPEEIPDRFTGDPLRLKQIMTNLIGNAVKFTQKGEIAFSAAVEERQGSVVLLRFDVADTGIGINPEAIERIFKPFEQADSSMSRKFGGTGLGLAICTQLTALMGGEIWVDSREGAGSFFHVRIPLASSDALPEAGGARRIDHTPLWEGDPSRVLLVEDNEITRKLFIGMLNKYGHHVDIALNGAEALEKLSRADYDIVLMDVQMPVMDGIEAVGRLRERERERGGHVPVVAITALAMERDRLKLLSKGFDGYVSKPTRMRELLGEMKRCLGG